MAGPGVALRLHEFRESQDCSRVDGPDRTTHKASRQGRDVPGLYPGQLGRVHTVHSKDCGSSLQSVRFLSLRCEDYQRGFDLRTLQALSVLHHGPAAPEPRPPQTAYQEQFSLQAALCQQQPDTLSQG